MCLILKLKFSYQKKIETNDSDFLSKLISSLLSELITRPVSG